VSRGLLSLHVGEPWNTHITLSIPLLPSLFPYLQSIAWLKVHATQTGLYTRTEEKDDLTVSIIDQLPHLRRIWFVSSHSWGFPANVEDFITKIQEVSNKGDRPLHAIYVYALFEHFANAISHTYTKASTHRHSRTWGAGNIIVERSKTIFEIESRTFLNSDKWSRDVYGY